MHAAARPPMPGGMGMMPQANGPTPGIAPNGEGLPHKPYMEPPGPHGYNSHPSQPVGMPQYRCVHKFHNCMHIIFR